MLKLEHVSKYYNTNNNVTMGLHDISIELELGEIVAVTGESGSGKSTFLNVITGIDSYEDGEMYFNGEETSYYNNEDLEKYRKDNVGFIFQNYNLIDSYSVLQNVMMPLLLRGYDKKEAKKKALEIIETVGLKNRLRNKGTQLSGGEAQRVSIARAIASDSLILACDEPTGNLDSKTGKEIVELIKKVSEGRLVVIVTHNYPEIEGIATRKITFHDGEIIEDTDLREKTVSNKETKSIDYDIKVKDCFSYAMKNIMATPKKTIFSCAVFLLVAFIICSLIGLTFYIGNQEDYSAYVYNNCNENRVVVYNEKGIDVDKIKEKYSTLSIVERSYDEDNLTLFSYMNSSDYFDSNVLVDFRKEMPTKLVYGKMPKASNEVLLGISKDRINEYASMIGEECFLSYNGGFGGNKVIYTGIYEYDTSREYSVVYIPNAELAEKVKREYYMGILKDKLSLRLGKSSIDSINVEYNEKITGIKLVTNEEDYDLYKNTKLYYADDISEKELNFVVDKTGTTDSFIVEVGTDYLDIIACDRQISIYANNKISVKDIVNYAESLEYSASLPSKVTRGIDIENIIFKIVFIITSFFILLAIIPVYFVSYLVLSRIYASKNKDYAIMRTLGVKKKEMALIVYFEIGFLCIVSSLAVFIVLKILSMCLHDEFWIIYQSFNVGNSFIYLLTVLIFALLMGTRFNKKLFKFSVNSTMKKEAMEND